MRRTGLSSLPEMDILYETGSSFFFSIQADPASIIRSWKSALDPERLYTSNKVFGFYYFHSEGRYDFYILFCCSLRIVLWQQQDNHPPETDLIFPDNLYFDP